MTNPDLVGIHEIATRLSVKRATVDQWRHRKLLPAPRWVVSGTPMWTWAEIEVWAAATGRDSAAQSRRGGDTSVSAG